MYFRTRVQLPAPPFLSEGLRPSDSPTPSLARRFPPSLFELRRGRPPARSVPVARSLRSLAAVSAASPLGLPYTVTRAPLPAFALRATAGQAAGALRSGGSFAGSLRCAHSLSIAEAQSGSEPRLGRRRARRCPRECPSRSRASSMWLHCP